MQLTHFGHACVLVETATARLLIDPGTLASGFEPASDLDAVLITHQHPDHLDLARLPGLLAANPSALLLVDAGSAPLVRDAGLPHSVIGPGDRMSAGGARIDVIGGEHALVHADIPVVPNGALVIDEGAFYHPGDSWVVPEQDIDVFGLPASGPWVKVGEAVDFMRAVAPRIAVPIHEAALASTATHYAILSGLSPEATAFTPLAHSVATEL